MIISKRICELCEERDLSQLDLAKGIDAGQKSISNWESGSHEPPATAVYKLAKFFGVSSDYLLGLTDEW